MHIGVSKWDELKIFSGESKLGGKYFSIDQEQWRVLMPKYIE
jgi:hypothetical protein